MIINRILLSFILSFFVTVIISVIYVYSVYQSIDLSNLFSLNKTKLFDFYSQNLRGHLFSAFLGLGGFLLSLKTFIIVNMKDKLFDSKKYIERWNKSNKESSLLTPLKELSDILYFAILMSIITAISQMTLGFIKIDISAFICIYLALVSTFLLIDSLGIIKRNLNTMFEYDDKKS